MNDLLALCQNDEFFSEYHFINEKLIKAEIRYTHMNGCTFQNCTFDSVIFEQINFTNCFFQNCHC